ncbi:hypothetical protein JKP88DRAFT_247467 [Tribonema minus]|nr:hypothetical protein JKP88DRAFT_247467 [Tribonema minus]
MKRLFGEATATGTCTNCADQTPLAEHCLLCAPCLQQYRREVFIKPLLQQMQHRHKKWKDAGDPRGNELCDITLDSMRVETCALTGMPMVTAPYSHWQMSPERKDPTRGYTTDNVCYVILELNHANQMTPAKVDFAFTSFSGHPPYDTSELDCTAPRRGQCGAVTMPVLQRDNPPKVRCNVCTKRAGVDVWKPFTDFAAATVTMGSCKSCKAVRNMAVSGPWRGAFSNILNDARLSARRHTRKVGDLTLDQLIAKLHGQRGLCFYSDMRMYSRKGHWRVSLERLNSAVGYTDANTVLVCQEFNVRDRSGSPNAPPTAGGGWSRPKVETVRTFMKNARMQEPRCQWNCLNKL